MCFSNLQISKWKYSKSLSWTWNLNFPPITVNNIFKFQAQDSNLDFFFWDLEIWKMVRTFWKKVTFRTNHTWIFFCESLKVVWSSTWPLSKAIIPISNVLVFFSGKSIQSLTVSQSLSLSHFQDYWVLEFQAMYFICNYCTFFIYLYRNLSDNITLRFRITMLYAYLFSWFFPTNRPLFHPG